MIRMSDMVKQRNSQVELFRCLLMVGICVLHCANANHVTWLAWMLCPCVVGFVFISGWFGVKFSLSKIVYLYGVQLYCVVVVRIVSHHVLNEPLTLSSIMYGMTQFWFVHAYVLMILLSPLVNVVVAQQDKHVVLQCLLPFWLAIFGWGFVSHSHIVKGLVPTTDGLGVFSGLTLLGIYSVGRVCNLWHLLDCVGYRKCLFGVMVAFPLMILHLGVYNSPLAVILMAMFFYIVARTKSRYSRIVLFLSPSIFSVYIIHTTRLGSVLSERLVSALGGGVPAVMISGIAIFIAAILFDMPRRYICHLLAYGKFLNRIDNIFDLFLRWLHERICRGVLNRGCCNTDEFIS